MVGLLLTKFSEAVKWGSSRALESGYVLTPHILTAFIRGEPAGFRPKDAEKFLKLYSKSIGFAEGFPATEAFNTFTKNRIHNLDGFKTININGLSLVDQLSDEAKKTLNNQISEALKSTEETQKAQQQFAEFAKEINQMALDPSGKHKPAAILNRLVEARTTFFDAINKQKESDQNQLTSLFQNEDFKATLNAALGEVNVNKLRADMLNALNEQHNKEKKAFEKTYNDRLLHMHVELQRESARINFLAIQIKSLQKGKNAAVSLGVEVNDDKSILLKGKKIQDFDQLVTLTGRTIQKANDDEYTISLPRRLDFIYYNSHLIQKDLESLAMAHYAAGAESIEFKIKCKDQKLGEELGRKSYEAARRVGFPADKIRVFVNGQVMHNLSDKEKKQRSKLSREERSTGIFERDGHETRHRLAEQKGSVREREFEKIQQKYMGEFNYKDELQKLKSQQGGAAAEQTKKAEALEADRQAGRSTPAAN